MLGRPFRTSDCYCMYSQQSCDLAKLHVHVPCLIPCDQVHLQADWSRSKSRHKVSWQAQTRMELFTCRSTCMRNKSSLVCVEGKLAYYLTRPTTSACSLQLDIFLHVHLNPHASEEGSCSCLPEVCWSVFCYVCLLLLGFVWAACYCTVRLHAYMYTHMPHTYTLQCARLCAM